jgi:hypothetical protein
MMGEASPAAAVACGLLLAGAASASAGEEAPGTAWSISAGDIKDEQAGGCLLRDDGMLLVCGGTHSYSTGDSDGLVLLVDPENGRIEWERPYGGRDEDCLLDLAPAPNGGFYAVGRSGSGSRGGDDLWVLRCDAAGDVLWQRHLGGEMNDEAVAAVSDSGLVVAGTTWSRGAGGSDGWLVRLTDGGEVEWSRTFGGSGTDRFFDVALTGGRYLATGTTYSEGEHGDVLTVWIDPWGMETARMVWGGPDYDHGRAAIALPAGGAAICCWSKASVCNLAVLVADSSGQLLRETVVPIGYPTRAEDILPAPDGAVLVAGTRETSDPGGRDIFLWKVSSGGRLSWETLTGGTGNEDLASMAVTDGGRPVLTATTTSTGRSDSDIWLVGLEELPWRGTADDH